MVNTNDLTLRVVFRTVHDVLVNKRTAFNPTTLQYLETAAEILSNVADTFDAIARREVLPDMKASEPNRQFLLSRTQVFAEPSHASSSASISAEELEKLATHLRDQAAFVYQIRRNPDYAHGTEKGRRESLLSLSASIVQATAESEPLLDRVEEVVS